LCRPLAAPILGDRLSFIDFFYQLNEIFDLLQHDAMRRLYAFENRRAGEWLK
jgi:hypothetical protein